MGRPEKYDFCGWATKSNIKCSDGRTILKHAFKDNDGCTVPLVWNHNHRDADNVLGHAYLENKDEGVYAYCSFNETSQGNNAKELVKHGDIVSLSIFANQLKQDGSNVVHGNIREVSLVLAGANPGALIEDVLTHGEEEGESARMYNDSQIELTHGEESQEKQEEIAKPAEEAKPEAKQEEEIAHAEKTVQEVIDSMTDEQKEVLYLLVGVAASKDKEDEEESSQGDENKMKHNAFENIKKDDGTELQHSEFVSIIEEAKRGSSLKDTFIAHGITDIGELFPEAQPVNAAPEMIMRDQNWVQQVMGAVHHTPFSRVKSTAANLTAADARAKGYVKTHQKVEEVLSALKRTTPPQTVYKLQKLDRDDVVDITDFDVVAWIKREMRLMLDEELARAFLIGDGRDGSSDDKINPLNIRPIWQDNPTYTINKVVERPSGGDDYAMAKEVIRAVVKARKDYKGSGNPVFYTTEDMLTNMLLLEDKNERVIYDTVEKLRTALRVSAIVTVPVMEGAQRESGNDTYALLGILVNLNDYNVGADKGGAVSLFDDFDINYNKYEYLIETRCSGALVKPYSAVTFEEKLAGE